MDWFEILKQEKTELDERITKLNSFIGGSQFTTLDNQNKILLRRQLFTMQQYSNILNQRIIINNSEV